MKITKNLLLTGIMAVFCCSIGNAQTLLYSNAFNGTTYTSVYQTPPNGYATNFMGASSSAVWACTFTNLNPAVNNPGSAYGANNYGAGMVYLNGAISTNQGCALLPLTVLTNAVYILNASVAIPNANTFIEMGFTVNNGAGISPYFQTNISYCRFNDNPPDGYAFEYVRDDTTSGFWVGPKATYEDENTGALADLTPSAGTYQLEVILNTLNNTNEYSITNVLHHGETNDWVATAFIGTNQIGTNVIYAASASGAPPFALNDCGLGSSGFSIGASPAGFQWNYFTVSTPLLPMITQQPVSASAVSGATFTNTVMTLADTNGGSLFYQWYTNGVAIAGATNASLILNPVLSFDAGTNYYVVVTNTYGAVTSAPASLIVYAAPAFSSVIPISYTNPITLYGGTNSDGTNYIGSTPTFSVSVTGGSPLAYQWLTNGVAVGGATNTSFTFTNCQLSSPTNFSCVVTNNDGWVSNTWSAVYLPAPTAPFPQTVLSTVPVAFWRLNEQPDNGNGDDGTIANDYQSGNNGIYTNVVLDQTGYNPAEPGETSVLFGSGGNDNSYVGSIEGVDFAAPTGSNAEFTVEAWANGVTADTGAPVVSEGTYGVSDAFGLGADTNPSQRNYQFYVRSAAGTVYTADSTVPLSGNWVHLVGVCDEANSNVLLYINGQLAASSFIPTNAGEYEAGAPLAIGAGTQGASDGYNVQFFGYIDDVAAYNYAFSPALVAELYQTVGGAITPYFIQLPETNAVLTNTTLTIPATAFGSAPLGYYWTNLNTATLIGSGATNAIAPLNATLTLTGVTTNMDGDVLELVVTNAAGSTNWFVTLSLPIPPPPPPQTISYTNSILYSNSFDGGSSTIAGTASTLDNSLVGGTNSTWTDALGINDTGTMEASGLDNSEEPDSWVLPFTPESGYVYTVTATLTFSGNPGNWIGLGFAERVPTNAAVGYGRFSDGGATPPDEGPEGYDWMILTESSGNVQYFAGPGGSNPILGENGFFTANTPATHTVQVVLATTNAQWTIASYVDGVQAGTNYPYAAGANPPIGAVGITQNALTALGDLQWNSFTLSQVAPGGVPPYLLATTLPASVSLTNATVTIPATAFGSAPMGYYWINNSTVLASGVTNTPNPITPNNAAPIPANLSVPTSGLSVGQLELVVTNAYGTNITVIPLVAPTPAQILGYTNSILYSNSFDGGAVTIAGTQPTAINILADTNSIWIDALGINDNGSMLANGTDATTLPDSWVLPFTPESGYVYTATASLTFSGDPGNWIGLGFAQNVPTNAAVGYGRFSDGGTTPPDEGPEGYDWIILTESSGNVQNFAGPGGSNPILAEDGFFTAGTPATHTVQVVLATTNAQWTIASYVDGVQAGTNYTYAAGANPPIGAVGITQNTLTTPSDLQWNSFTLTEVAPGGVPPYLLSPLPPASASLTNATVTIPATAFGSAPLGYYWINNSTVLTSGITNNMAPLPASLSVASSSLSGGQLELVVTNAYGTNITLVTLISTLPTTGTNIMWGATNGNLYMSWPSSYTGWQLQAQTNSLSTGISTNWVNVSGTTLTNQVVIPINLTNGSVFYRLTY